MSRRGVGSIRQVSRGVWRVELTHGRNPVTGDLNRLSRNVRGSKREAEAELSRMLVEIGQVDTNTMTLAQYLDDVYLPFAKQRLAQTTYNGYTSKLDAHVRDPLGSLRLSTLEPFVLDRWMANVQGGDQTRAHVYTVLHTALSQAVKWRMIAVNPLESVEKPKVRRRKQDVLSLSEAQAYLDAFRGHVLEPVVIIGIAGGLRRCELAALTWADVTFGDLADVTIDKGMHQRNSDVWIRHDAKNETSRRTVTLPAWATERLRQLRGIGPLCPLHGEAMKPDTMARMFTSHAADCGLRRIPMKNLRHTSATLSLAAGVDLVSVSRRLGHSTVTITDAIYIAPGREADRLVAEALDGLLSTGESQALSGVKA